MSKWSAPEGYITAKQAAARLGVSDRTIIRRLESGQLQGMKTDSLLVLAWVVLESEVNVALEVVEAVKVKNEHELADFAMMIAGLYARARCPVGG